MDKQIIIDDVDVSGCEHRCDTHKTLLADGHIKEFKNYCQITNDGCYAINCYYKQLKRKEEELEQVRNAYEVCKESRLNVYNKLDAKEQECEELKEIINEAQNSGLDLKSFLVGEAVRNEYEQQLDQLKVEKDELKKEIKHYKQIAQYHGDLSVKYTNRSAKYKQTLTEIKGIAEETIRIADLEGLNGVYRRGLAKLILQKISEVIK